MSVEEYLRNFAGRLPRLCRRFGSAAKTNGLDRIPLRTINLEDKAASSRAPRQEWLERYWTRRLSFPPT